MISALPPVLLTSCIYIADHAVKLADPTARINYTLESIEKWLSIAPGIRLVVCDSSGFDFAPVVKEKYPHADIECLFFEADKSLVQHHGKGYGEGQIIRHALQNSVYLAQADFFAKCTAKLWVENFKECLAEWNGRFLCHATFTHVFSLKKTCFDHVDTRFYLASRDFYNQYLLDAHLDLGAHTGTSIEDSFRNIILQNHLSSVIFRIPPLIGGVGGGTGKYYNIRPHKKFKEYLRYRLVRLSPRWNPLFNQVQ